MVARFRGSFAVYEHLVLIFLGAVFNVTVTTAVRADFIVGFSVFRHVIDGTDQHLLTATFTPSLSNIALKSFITVRSLTVLLDNT